VAELGGADWAVNTPVTSISYDNEMRDLQASQARADTLRLMRGTADELERAAGMYRQAAAP
jgi:hypothetical protein